MKIALLLCLGFVLVFSGFVAGQSIDGSELGDFEFSPNSLTYLLEPGEELCQVIEIVEEASVSYYWGEDVSALDLGLSLSYLKEVVDGEVEVCLSGSELGEFDGEIIFEGSDFSKEVMIKVVVEEDGEGGDGEGGGEGEDLGDGDEESGSGGDVDGNLGGGSGGGSGKIDVSVTIAEPKDGNGGFEELSADVELSGEDVEGSGGVSGQVVSFDEGQSIGFRNLIPIAFIVLVIGARVWVVRKNKKRWGE